MTRLSPLSPLPPVQTPQPNEPAWELYTEAALHLGHTLAEHHIKTTADLFEDMMEIYWELLKTGPVMLDCKSGMLVFGTPGKDGRWII